MLVRPVPLSASSANVSTASVSEHHLLPLHLPARAQQRLAAPASDAPSIRIHRLAVVGLPFPVQRAPLRLADVAANGHGRQRGHRGVAVIALVGHHLGSTTPRLSAWTRPSLSRTCHFQGKRVNRVVAPRDCRIPREAEKMNIVHASNDLKDVKRLRILISAHELSPFQGSECGRGWSVPMRLAEHHDVTVLFATGNHKNPQKYSDDVRTYIERHGPIKGLSLVSVPIPTYSRCLSRLGRIMPTGGIDEVGFRVFHAFLLRQWHRKASVTARQLHAERPFDIAHQLNPLMFREPGYLWKLGIPFVWGPISGTGLVPFRFAASLGVRGCAFELLRTMVVSWNRRHCRRAKMAAAAAFRVLTVTPEDSRWCARWGANTDLLSETSCKYISDCVHSYDGRERLRIAWCGQCRPAKALQLLLSALDSHLCSRVELHVIGDGPCRQRWERQANSQGIHTVWHGLVKAQEVTPIVNRCHILAMTSVREGTTNVIMEALATGLPVICHDAYGMGIAVSKESGILIPYVSPKQSVECLREAIYQLIRSPQRVEELSRGALRRAAELTVEQQVSRILEVYEGAVRGRSEV